MDQIGNIGNISRKKKQTKRRSPGGGQTSTRGFDSGQPENGSEHAAKRDNGKFRKTSFPE